MSYRASMTVLRNYSCKFYHCNSLSILNPTSLPNINLPKRLFAYSVPQTIQAKGLTNQPTEKTLSCVQKETTVTESVMLLKALRINMLFKGSQATNLHQDQRFKNLCDIFEQNCDILHPGLLVSGLRSLLEVGVPPTADCVVAAEKSILKNIHHFQVLNLIGCLYYHHKYTETGLQKKVVAALTRSIQKRVSEISNPAEVLMLLHTYNLFQDQYQKSLEIQIIEVLPFFRTQELCKLFAVMGEMSIRNVFILNAAASCLCGKTEKPDLKETVDLFYSFKKLNFYEPKLYAQLLNDLPLQIPSVEQASLISGLLTICGHVRWKDTGILNACGEWIQKNFQSCRTREFVSYILTVAALNHSTDETKAVLKLISPQVTLSNVKSPSILLDVIWSLAIFNCEPKELLVKVLSSNFYKSLKVELGSQATHSVRLKLLNLKGILKNKYPECVFGCDLYLDSIRLRESPVIEKCREHVVKVLSNFVPINKHLCINQVSDTGIFIDAEMIMDKHVRPLSLEEYGVLGKTEGTSKKLPKDAKRIALLILFSKDITHYTYSLTGVNALAIRLLTDAGYTVVTILYDEFSENKTEIQKAKYLLGKIKDSVKKS